MEHAGRGQGQHNYQEHQLLHRSLLASCERGPCNLPFRAALTEGPPSRATGQLSKGPPSPSIAKRARPSARAPCDLLGMDSPSDLKLIPGRHVCEDPLLHDREIRWHEPLQRLHLRITANLRLPLVMVGSGQDGEGVIAVTSSFQGGLPCALVLLGKDVVVQAP